jgi:dihydropyrimidine dehydrogenase (NAD+) subunit PreT
MNSQYLKELEPGFTPVTICEEAARCLLCHDAPCSRSCPAGTDPGKFIRSVRFRNFKGAAETIRENNILGAICARVCPTEKYCQDACSRCGIDRPIDIGRIQRYVTDLEESLDMKILEKPSTRTGKSIAVIGGGPGGLSIAADLLLKGHSVELFEKEDKLGGMLRYGIPEYRLPTHVVDHEIQRILDLGLKVHTGVKVGEELTLDALKERFDAVVLAVGLSAGKWLPVFDGNSNVETALSFLKRAKETGGKLAVGANILVIGGGDVSMDVCTTLKILGAKNVTAVVYEEFCEFKASKKELENARAMEVSIYDGYIPTKAEGKTVTFRHRKIDSELRFTADRIILAVGQALDADKLGVHFTANQADSCNYRVENSNVFVVGDISECKEKSVVGAVRSAKEAAVSIDTYLEGK